jgi:hypothetical protein
MALEDLQRALPFLAAIGPHQIEVLPVGGDFGPEIGWITEGFPIKGLIFNETVDGFDIALSGVTLGRDVAAPTAQGAHGGG